MKLRKKLERQWSDVHQSGKQQVRRRPYVLPLLGVVMGLAVLGILTLTHRGDGLKPSNLHVVFLFDGGKRQTIDTGSATVGDLVDKLPLHLIPEDVVEPTRDTPIVEDNFRINVYRARPVTVVDGSTKTVTLTAQKSPRVVAESAGLKIFPEDAPIFAPGSIKQNIIGEMVTIERATPISLNLYGTPLTVHTHAKTVASLLKEKHIKLQKDDGVQPRLDTPLTADLQVFIIRSGTKIETVEEAIPAPVQIVTDASLSLGTSVVRQPGAAGKKAVTYQIQMQNGKESGRVVIQQAVILDPVPQIVARGSVVAVTGSHESWMAAAGISSGDYGYVNYIISRESNWNPASLNGSGCAGLGQACPGSKLAAACPGWQSNPTCQLRFFTSYAVGRFGSWGGAYNYWLSHGYW